MKKFYNFLSFTWLVALTILLSTGGVQAQLAPKYPLTISTGTYSSISATGTSVASGDEVGTNITGFTGFTVNSVTYTNARMCSNGWLALYTTTAPTATANYAALSTAMTDGAVIFAPYGRDLNTDANSGTAWWQQVGNELVFEWKNFNRYAYTDVLNFQIRLNTSTGEIKFVYGTMTPAANTTYPQVGWKTNGTVAANWSTDINNVMIDVTGSPNTCNWSNVVTGNTNSSTCYFNSANSGVVPASGLTYSWTKPNGTDPNPVRTFSAVSSITTSAATLTWTAPTGATQYNVQYRAMGSCTWTNFSGNPVSSATATLTGLSPATTYQIRVQSGNGSVNGLWSHIPNQAGTGNGYVAAGTFTTLANACAGTPAPGNTVSSANPVCSGVNFTLSLQNPPTETGITYQWQSADDAAFTIGVTNLGTASTQTTSQTTAKYYRCNVTCTNSGLSAYSTALQVTMSLPTYATYNNVSYTESFESWVNGCSTSDRPSAAWENSPNTGNASWRRNDQGSTAGWTSPTYGVYSPVFTDGSYSARFHSSYATGGAKGSLSLYVNMTAATGNTRLSFDHINTDGTDVLKVFLSTDGGVTFTQQGTDIGISAVWTNKTFDFNSTSATTVIKLEATSDYGSTDIGIDKLKLEPVPSCLPTTATAASNITATTASANWSTATGSWIIEYGPTATFGTPGTGATAGNGNNTVVTASNMSTIGLTGLTASTGYSYVVRQDCSGSGNGYSANSNVITFTTSQIPATLPYTQNFASNDFGFVNGSQTNQWAYGTATGNPANAIYVSNDGGTTNNYNTGAASVVHAYRDITIPSGSTLANFSFDWKANGESCCDYLRVWLVPTSYTPTAGSQITVDPSRIQVGGNLNQQSSWQTYSNNALDVSSFAGQTMRLVFEWRNDGSVGTNPPAAVDNINIAVPTCPATTATAASNITATTASANWSTATGSWIIEYGPTATFGTPGTGATAGNVNNTVVTASNVSTIGLTGLTASTGYSYVVRQDCSGSGNGYSANSNVITFTTACAAIVSLPWTEGFESATLPNLPSTCWLEDPSSGDWVTTNNSNSTYDADARTGAQFLRDSWSATNEFVWTPGFALTSGQSYDFSFWWAGDTYSGWTGDIFYNTIQSGTGATQMGSSFVTSSTTTTKTYVQEKRTFVAPTTGTYYFAVRVNATSSPWYLSFDDFRFEQTPSCLPTTATAASNITAITASANWSTATGSWIIEYGPTATFGTPGTGATAGNGNNTVVTASGVSTIGLTGLTASTGYSYVVRQDCSGSGNGYSANSNVITFTTACNAVTSFPFIETFEDDSDSRDCWLNDYVSGNLPWALTDGDQGGGSVNSAHSGVLNAIFWQSADNGYETRYVSPSFDFTGKSKLYLDFYYANEEWLGSQSELRIYYKVGAGAWTLIPGAVYTTSVNAWTFVHLDLPSSDNASDYKIAFDGINQWSRGIVVDDVLINAKPDDCSNALGISSDPVTDYINPGTQFMSNATKSSVPDGSCFTTSPSSKDMWYKITTNGDNGSVLNLTVTPDASMDVALTLFDGTCGTLNAVACSNANSAGVAENMVYTLPLWDGGIEVRANKVYFLRVTDIGGNGTSFTIGNNGSTALPLTLLSFKAQQVKRGEVLLDWRVKDEVNMKQYDVQRSVDGKNFTTIGTVNNLGKEVYTLIDTKPAQGINYYRLSMVESNGLTNYSHIVAININDGKALHASPNPVTGDLTVEVKGEVGKQAVIDIIDYTGNKVRTVAIPAGKVTVDMTSLPTGVYVVQYIDGTTVYTTRVVKM